MLKKVTLIKRDKPKEELSYGISEVFVIDAFDNDEETLLSSLKSLVKKDVSIKIEPIDVVTNTTFVGLFSFMYTSKGEKPC